jgi:hypothetical protein
VLRLISLISLIIREMALSHFPHVSPLSRQAGQGRG